MNHSKRLIERASVWLALAGGVAVVVGCGQAPVAAPSSYAEYNVKDGTFACEYPEGWEAAGGGKHGPIWATFTSGPAEIRIRGDLVGSLVGDIASSFGGSSSGEVLPPELEPVHQIHVAAAEDAKDDYSGYEEISEPAVLDVRLGPARVSEFTASTTFGSGLHGYRVTVLGHDKRVQAYCVCPESDWETLRPAFDHVLSTLRRGIQE